MNDLDSHMPTGGIDKPLDFSRLTTLLESTNRRCCVLCNAEFDAVGLTAVCDACEMVPHERKPREMSPSWPKRHVDRLATMHGPSLEMAQRLAPKMIGGKLCVLAGNRGLGKTQIVTFIAKWRADNDYSPGLYARAYDVVSRVVGFDRDERLEEYQRAGFLVLDEIHRVDQRGMPLLESIVDDRYANNKATIIIGNWLTLDGIHRGEEVDGEKLHGVGSSLMSRIQEHQRDKTGGVVWCRWNSYRE